MRAPRRLYASSLETERVTLAPEALRHAKVLRLGIGDAVELFDGRGGEADAILESLDPPRARITARRAAPEAARVVLVQALPKGAKLDEIVRAATECGVTAIHLAITERTIARPDADRALARLDRLHAIAREASRQSERASIPSIVAPAPLAEIASRAPSIAARLMLSPREGAPWRAAIAGAREVWCVIGPEGGLSDAEEASLIDRGFSRARLALPVLRVETAAPVAIAAIVDLLEQVAGTSELS